MKHLVFAVLVALVAVVIPTAAGQAQGSEPAGCQVGVFVEGRCVTVDGQSTLCAGTSCVEFVQESSDTCPSGTTDLGIDPLAGPSCQLIEPASQAPDVCPDGARGVVNDCFIYIAIGPDGCPSPSVIDASNNCRRPVANAQGAFFCEDGEAQLAGFDCISLFDKTASCPAGTTRFDGACWRMNGLVPPESCAGHQVPGTVELASGLCQVPVAIPTGPDTCVAPAQYSEYPVYVLISQSGVFQGNGPIFAACVDASMFGLGGSVAHCFFPDDDLNWADFGDPGLCTRFEEPTVLSCPTDFSFDDSLGGACARFESAVNGQCPAGGLLNGPSCVFTAEFSEFECPADTARHAIGSFCSATRNWQGAAFCGPDGARLSSGHGCVARSGPQPDSCNALGTIESCFEIQEPAPVACALTVGCVEFASFDGELCNGMIITIDMNLGASGVGTAGNDVILGTPGADSIDAGDGDDVVCAGAGADVVVAGNGDDTILGEAGRDVLRGGPGVDQVHGGGGDDRVLGGIGNDTMTGGDGNDYMGGFGGADMIDGGPGSDRIFGGFGADLISGGDGDDVINGLVGDDTITGGAGNDTLSGDRGNDTINGDDGNDTIKGGNANDVLDGGTGDDSVSGGQADDTLVGGLGSDRCFGNKENVADTADATCETIVGVP